MRVKNSCSTLTKVRYRSSMYEIHSTNLQYDLVVKLKVYKIHRTNHSTDTVDIEGDF